VKDFKGVGRAQMEKKEGGGGGVLLSFASKKRLISSIQPVHLRI